MLRQPFSTVLGKAALLLPEIWERVQVRGRMGRDGHVKDIQLLCTRINARLYSQIFPAKEQN